MTTIQLRRASASQWSTKNPILAAGEPAFAVDAGVLKIGDGTTHWNDLATIEVGGMTNAEIAAILTSGGASKSALDAAYAALSHTHSIAQVTGLQAALDAKAVVVDAGGTAGTARPSTSAPVIWLVNVGITPTNAQSSDVILERNDPSVDLAAQSITLDKGLFGESFDSAVGAASSGLTSGSMVFARVKARKSGTINTLRCYIGTVASGGTVSYAKMAIYDLTSGAQLGITADQSADMVNLGSKAYAMTAGASVVQGTEYLIGMLQVGTGTLAALLRGFSGGAGNVGYTAAPYRFNQLTSQATVPATVTPGSLAGSSIAWWMGMS